MSDLVISGISGLGKGGAGTKAGSAGRRYQGSLGQRRDALKTVMQYVPRSLQVGDTAAYEVAEGQRLLGGMSGRGASGGHKIGKHRSITYSASGSKIREAFFDVVGKPTNVTYDVIEGKMGEFSASIVSAGDHSRHEAKVKERKSDGKAALGIAIPDTPVTGEISASYGRGATKASHHDREESRPTWRVEIKYSAKYKIGVGRHSVKFVVRYDLVGEKVGMMPPSVRSQRGVAAAAAPAPSASSGERLEAKARELMGGNFTGRAEWRELFGEEPEGIPELTEEMVQRLGSECPFDVLKRVKDTHILFCMPAKLRGQTLSIMEWKRVMQNGEHRSAHKKGKLLDKSWWYHDRKEKFAHEGVERGKWVLMPKKMVPGSTNKRWEEQEAIVEDNYGGQGYEVPSALELVSGIMLHYLRTGKRIISGKGYEVRSGGRLCLPHARTKSRNSYGVWVDVGHFNYSGSSGLNLLSTSYVHRGEDIGVAMVACGH